MSYGNYLPKNGKYAVEVGANDGHFQSVTLPLEKAGWDVLCVEGNPAYGEVLKGRRKNVLMVAVGAVNIDKVPFYINHLVPQSYSGLHSDPHCQETVYVPQRTLTWCLEQVEFPCLDLLVIDVEGGELEVLQGLDFSRWAPQTIIAERWDDEDYTLREFLGPLGYEFRIKTGYDEVFTRREDE